MTPGTEAPSRDLLGISDNFSVFESTVSDDVRAAGPNL